MQITIRQQVNVEGKLNTFREAYREFESDFYPRNGDLYEDSAFKDPYEYEVTGVSFNYQANFCTVYIKPVVLPPTCNQDHVKNYIEMMILHGWKCNVL